MKKLILIVGTTLAALVFASTSWADNVGQPAASTPSPAQSAVSRLINDSEPGWIWHGMAEYDDSGLQGGTGHAGGPGTYGAYTFRGTGVDVICMTGPSLTVDGRVHKMGRAKFSLDGKVVDLVSANTPDQQYGVILLHVLGLSDSYHVLQIEPESGWVVVDAIRVMQASSDGLSTGANAGTSQPSASVSPVDKALMSSIPEGDYRIAMRMDMNKYLTARDYPTDGTCMEIDTLSRERPQVWHVQPLDGGRYHISPASAPDEALSMLSTIVKSTGYAVGTWRYSGIPSEQWYIAPTDSGYYRIVNATDQNVVIDLLWADDHEGADLVTFKWHGATGQQWAFLGVSGQQ